MTDYLWQNSGEFRLLAPFAESRATDRQKRLFGCACLRMNWELLRDQRSRTAVDVAERYAAYLAKKEELRAARQAATVAQERVRGELTRDEWLRTQEHRPSDDPTSEVHFAGWRANLRAEVQVAEAAVVVTGTRIHCSLEALASIAAGVEFGMWFPGSAEHAVLLRDIFGNPFRPVAFDPSWGSSAALGLAWSMYESRDFAAMPILADALEESGCESADILSHCRGPGPHVRGCWVVDLVLGKS